VVQRNPGAPWEWYCLSANPFTMEKERFLRDYAARIVQMWWLKILLSPTHPVGRRRLERDYEIYVEGCQHLRVIK